MTISTITTLPAAPARTDAPATFISKADAFLAAIVTMQGELNTSIGQMNTDISGVNTSVTNAATSASNAAASAAAAESASNATLWVSGTSYSAGDVVYSPIDYLSYRANTATSGTTDPSLSADWVGLSVLLNMISPTLTGTVTEDIYALSGTTPTIDPDNGSIQTHTLTGNTTYTDGLSAGEAITIMIDDGTAYTVTWPTITWVNNLGTAPTLATTGYTVVVIWKVSTTLYGALVGDGT